MVRRMAGGTAELGSIAVVLSKTLAEKYHGEPEPLGWDWLIHFVCGPTPTGDLELSAHQVEQHRRPMPLPRVAMAGNVRRRQVRKTSCSLTPPAKLAAIRLRRSGSFDGSEPSEFRVLAFLGGDEVGIISSYLTSS